MSNNDDLNWLAAQRPPQPSGNHEAHDRALVALLRHASSRPARRRPALRLPGLLNSRMLALATATGAAAIAAAVVLSANGGGGLRVSGAQAGAGTQPLQAAVPHHSTRSSLIRLADDLSTTTAGSGDATLIQRTTDTGGQSITVYDLYGDNGTYYFSQAESGMPAQVAGNDNQGAGVFGREVAAAREAATGNVAQAAIDMANAPDPNRSPLMTPTSTTQASSAALLAKEKAIGMAGPGSLFDNWAWEDSQDAMIAGAGDPQVRAGVLKILATLPDVSVTQGSSDGQPTLVMTGGADEVGSGYSEQLTVNAETGMPIQFVGGKPGGPADTTVNYQVQRVTLSDVAAGQLPSF